MPYTSIQFIGYVIDTAPQINPDGSRTYLGLANPGRDIEARCALMLRAMETARAGLPQASPPRPPGTTLKVFMAPEFFFRGPTGAYGMDDVQVLVAALQDLAAGPGWDDWVFAFGTVVGCSSPTTDAPPFDIDDLGDWEVYNFCLMQQGGVAGEGDAGARVVMKELVSNIDFIVTRANPGGMLLGEVDPLAASRGSGSGREQQRVNYDGAGIFALQGITWGMDICLDHDETVQRLQRSPQRPGANLVQVQLVPSCGMSIQSPGVIVQSGGLVFNCDGLRDSRHSQLARQGPPLVNIPRAGAGIPVPGGAITLAGTSPVLAVPVSSLYAAGAGRLDVYPAQDIPAQLTVEGTCVELVWPAAKEWTFSFLLAYAPGGQFVSVMCKIRSPRLDFRGNNYYLPLALDTKDKAGRDVKVQMRLAPGSGGYAAAVWCKIAVAGFVFTGNALQFNAWAKEPAPRVIW